MPRRRRSSARLLEHAVDVIDVIRVDDDRWHRVPSGRVARGDAVPAGHAPVHRPAGVRGPGRAPGPGGTRGLADRHRRGGLGRGGARGDPLRRPGGRLLRRRPAHRAPADRGAVAAANGSGRASATAISSTLGTQDDCWCSPPWCRPATSRGRRSRAQIGRGTSTSGGKLVRRSPRDLLPGPASLLAFAAWQHGDGALAWCAIDRCLEVDPDYSLAHYVAEVLNHAVPPNGLASSSRRTTCRSSERWSRCTGVAIAPRRAPFPRLGCGSWAKKSICRSSPAPTARATGRRSGVPRRLRSDAERVARSNRAPHHRPGDRAQPGRRRRPSRPCATRGAGGDRRPGFETELGQFNIEINVPPRGSTRGVCRLRGRVRASLNAAEGKPARSAPTW